MNDICVYSTQTYEKQILHDYYCHIVVHGVCDVNLNIIFCRFFLSLTTNFKQNQVMLICTSRFSKLKKKIKNKKKEFTFVFFWGQIQAPFLLLEQWNVVLHHPPNFFLVFLVFSSLFFNTTIFFLGVVFFGMKTCLGISWGWDDHLGHHKVSILFC